MSQIAKKKFPQAMLLGGLSVNLNQLKTMRHFESFWVRTGQILTTLTVWT